MKMADGDEVFVLRNPARKFIYVVWVLFIGLSAFLAFSRPGGGKFVAVACGVVFVLAFVASLRAGVRCSPAGLVAIDDFGFRRRFDWDEVDHFEDRGLRGIGFVKRSGGWVKVTSYATLGDVSSEKATALLEQQRRRFRNAGPAGR
ncbi:hypothetical protein D1871_06345 [Nakamurella silvestris]|nr:hypothetical protein D1871_06345 [Nakamurella silvestris]